MQSKSIFSAFLLLGASATAAPHSATIIVQPKLAPAKSHHAPPPLRHHGRVNHYTRIMYEYIECDSNWNQDCDGTYTLAASNDWQVCRIVYRETTSDGHDAWFRFSPQNFYVGDPQRPPRFHEMSITIHAHGNHNPFDHRGSKERVENVGLDMIPFASSNYERASQNCMMPNGKARRRARAS